MEEERLIKGKKVMAIFQNEKEIKEVDPAILWDFAMSREKGSIKIFPFDLEKKKEEACSYAKGILQKYKEELLKEVERETRISENFRKIVHDDRIGELDTEILILEEKQARGELVEADLINKKREEKKKCEADYENFKKEIERDLSLTISMPEFLGAAYVIHSSSQEMVSDEEIEKIGMESALEHEKKEGRTPKDVSQKNLGYDIESEGKNGEIRYIEVKARKEEGYAGLTPNEWQRAKILKEKYWLYVVYNVVKSPKLRAINNPVENLNAQEKKEVVRFIIPEDEWKKGELVWEKV